MVILGWLVLSILVGVLANSKGRSGIGYTLISLFLSPLIGLIIILIVSEKKNEVESINNSLITKIKTLNKEFRNETYFITISNYDDQDIIEVKKQITEQYGKSYDKISVDSDYCWQIKNSEYSRTYIQVTTKNDILTIEGYNLQEEPKISVDTKDEEGSTNTDKLIELSKMLDKGLITEEEFKEHKLRL